MCVYVCVYDISNRWKAPAYEFFMSSIKELRIYTNDEESTGYMFIVNGIISYFPAHCSEFKRSQLYFEAFKYLHNWEIHFMCANYWFIHSLMK